MNIDGLLHNGVSNFILRADLVKQYFEDFYREVDFCDTDKLFISTLKNNNELVAISDEPISNWDAEHNAIPLNVYSVEPILINGVSFYRIANIETGEVALR